MFIEKLAAAKTQLCAGISFLKSKEYLRMVQWLILANLLYVGAIFLHQNEMAPVAQTVMLKLGNITLAAYAGYWFDRTSSRTRITAESGSLEYIRRAIIIAGAMIAVAMAV